MRIRAGIVGPRDSVNLIAVIAKEYSDKLNPIPFTYIKPEETTDIVEKNQHYVDIWIFTGLTPYTFAKKSSSSQLFFYLTLDGSSLSHVLLKIGYLDRKALHRISIDLLAERDVDETYRDLGIPRKNVYHFEYPGVTRTEEILSFHQGLFQEGKVDVCVTCLSLVHEQLQAQGIPAYRIIPTRTNIRKTVETALQQWETLYFKQSQISIMLIKIEKMEKITDHQAVSYDLHRLNLSLQSTILDFSESISGSFVSLGMGTFIIFSTRGSFQEADRQMVTLLENLEQITALPWNIGIGYGDTSLSAEKNARLALHHAQNYSDCCAFLVDDKGIIEGPLMDHQSISFGYRTEEDEDSQKLKAEGLTVTTLNKILSIQKRMGNTITAVNVAEWLKMTQRNARRILNALVEQGLAEIIGEEAPSSKGRPRKIYRVNMKEDTAIHP